MSVTDTPTEPNTLSNLSKDAGHSGYRVFARKYRPQTFSQLIGQKVLVRTLFNAFKLNRLAHAFILSGVRGVGKTTTARIISRALNCDGGTDLRKGSVEPCGVCENCSAIAEDRHVDVIEMDAASRTGVDDIRELIDSVRYRPTSARFKVYIIDEVHMLSRNAFNALLKTLEEPPEHVKFIFATTEIRKVPVTVLSRCQRFDLTRVDIKTLADHFGQISRRENARITEPALHLIARAADGSVRDGLSILDQVISQSDDEITANQVREMLGLVDRAQTFDLLEAVLMGRIPDALEQFEQNYQDGADPMAILTDMLEVVHWLTRIKVVPGAADSMEVTETERNRGWDMQSRLKMPVLARAWQMLLKGLEEARFAPSTRQAAEMILIRLAFTSSLPTPDEALKRDDLEQSFKNSPIPPATLAPSFDPSVPKSMKRTGSSVDVEETVVKSISDVTSGSGEKEAQEAPVHRSYESFIDIVVLAETVGEFVLKAHLENEVHVITFEPGHIEFRPSKAAPPNLAEKLNNFLNEHTDLRWIVRVSGQDGSPTIMETRVEGQELLKAEAAKHPLVQSVIDAFPGAKLTDVNPINDKPDAEER